MSERNWDSSDLDAILAEFSSAPPAPPAPAPEPEKKPAPEAENKAAPAPAGKPAPPAPAPQAPKAAPAGKAPSAGQNKPQEPLRLGIYTLVLLLALLSLSWAFLHLHLAPVAVQSAGAASLAPTGRADLAYRTESLMNAAAGEALEHVEFVKKIYTIPENDLVAPRPDPAKFGYTDDPAVIQAVIDSASELLEGQELSWSADIEFMPGTQMGYYCDDSLLVITWKEGINGAACSFAEIKMAHGSQLRRALAGNSYGSSVQLKASDMAKAANAVAAINGDFYDYRKLGITAWQRQVYRVVPGKVESAFFTASGDMLFSHLGELAGEGEAQKFVDDNDVIFAVAFGPILVENGELKHIDSYPIGEVDNQYSRSVIAQKDKLHYLLLTMGQEGNFVRRGTINDTAKVIYAKGVQSAYALDGGQTSTLVFNGTPYNRVDWDAERTMSDIIYFATAIPGEEVGS